jgi:hypothetical protein
VPESEREFSLLLGGPLYQLYLRTRLARTTLDLVVRRTAIIALICWLPLLVLAAMAGHLTGGVVVPFVRDPEVHIRFLAALPLLIVSEVYVHERMHTMVPQFLEHNLIAPQDQPRFQKMVTSAMRLRDSVVAELVLLGLVLTMGYWVWQQNFPLTVSTWYRINTATGLHLTTAGWYYSFISLSIFRFILIRWYYRLFIWYRFLWHVRKLRLHFNFYHPDRSGGLGFLSTSVEAFAPVFVSQIMVVSGTILTRILYAGAQLPAFKFEIAGALVLAMLVIVFPLLFFAPQLEQAGRKARHEFGTLASEYVEDFRGKWVEHRNPAGEPLLGTPDIQSLADLANSFTVANETRLVPISKQTLIRLVIMVALPVVPLTLTMFSLEELIRRLFKLGF